MILSYTIWTQTYTFDKDVAAEYVTTHAELKSRTCCAWYVMRAMQEGGCPIGILPAWAYRYALPLYGFKEVSKSGYIPKKGDLVVFPAVGEHIFGHIAMWNGKQWVSDFKQKNLICATAYSTVSYKLYRHR